MSKSDFEHHQVGCYPWELDDKNLRSIQEVLNSIKPAFEGTTNFSLEFYLQRIANATTMDSVKDIVAPFWTIPDEPMTNLYQLLLALNLLIKTFDDNKEDIFHLLLKGQAVHVYVRQLREAQEFDSESLADELSAASEKDLTKELKLAEKKFNQENLPDEDKNVNKNDATGNVMMDEIAELDTTNVAIEKFSSPTLQIDTNPWIQTPAAKTVPPTSISVTKITKKNEAMTSDKNSFTLLQYDDDDDDDDDDDHNACYRAIQWLYISYE